MGIFLIRWIQCYMLSQRYFSPDLRRVGYVSVNLWFDTYKGPKRDLNTGINSYTQPPWFSAKFQLN